MRISKATFDYRLSILKIKCGISPLDLCFKRHPFQLATREVQAIKYAFLNPDFHASLPFRFTIIYYDKNNQVFPWALFINSFVFLDWKNYWLKAIAKTVGFVSKKLNEYLHVDTTFWEFSLSEIAAIDFV